MVSKNPAAKAAAASGQGNVRGTKRTCQNDACGARFYDLNRDPIECPVCGAAYVTHAAPEQAAVPAPEAGSTGRGADQSDRLQADQTSAPGDEGDLVDVDEADLDDADIGLEIDDEADAEDEIEGVRGAGRGKAPD